MNQSSVFPILFILLIQGPALALPGRCRDVFEVVYSPFETDITGNYIEFIDGENGFTYFASLSTSGVLRIAAQLVLPDSRKRSYLRGRELFDFTINYFTVEEIKAIEGQWYKTSVNYQQFQKALEEGYEPQEAVFQTWTGRQVRRHGFTKVESIRYDVDDKHGEQIAVVVRYLLALIP